MPVTIPMRGIFETCCAWTAEHGARSSEQRARRMIFLVIARLLAFRSPTSGFIYDRCRLMTLSALANTWGGIAVRFSILDWSIIELHCLLWLIHVPGSSNRSAWQFSN